MRKRLKILVLTNLFPTPWDPHRSAFNRQQFERLGQRHEVDVLTAVDFRERLRGRRGTVDIPGVRKHYFTFLYPPLIGRSLHALCWLICLLLQRGARVRAANYDVILASWGYPDAVAAGWLARMLGVPYVVKLHGSDINVLAASGLRRWQVGQSLRFAGGVVAVSRALADKAIALGATPARVLTIYNGVDSERFAPGSRFDARARLQIADKGLLLLFVGNLKRAKGCIDLLEAFPALLLKQPQARLIFIGTGACRAELLERAEELGCASRVELCGGVLHAQLGDWFRAADVLCLPSHNEGVPNVVLEAMACGTPVVATRVGGIPEVLPSFAGILVRPHDPQGLGEALIAASTCAWETDHIAQHGSSFRWEDNIDSIDLMLAAAATGAVPPSNLSSEPVADDADEQRR